LKQLYQYIKQDFFSLINIDALDVQSMKKHFLC